MVSTVLPTCAFTLSASVGESTAASFVSKIKSFGNLKTFTYLPQHLTYGNINEYCGEVGNIYPSIAIFKMLTKLVSISTL